MPFVINAFCTPRRPLPVPPLACGGRAKGSNVMGPSGEPWDIQPPHGRIARGDFHLSRARGKGLIRQRDRQIKTINAAESLMYSDVTAQSWAGLFYLFQIFSKGIKCHFNCSHKSTCNHQNSPFCLERAIWWSNIHVIPFPNSLLRGNLSGRLIKTTSSFMYFCPSFL